MRRHIIRISKIGQYLLILGFALGGSAVLVAYASGLRYDPDLKVIVKTGLIILESRPRDATVTVNGKPHKERTPTRFDGLTPDTYNLTVSKRGYRAWTKNALVEEGLLTNLTYLLLLPNEVFPEIAAPLPVKSFALSNNGKEIALISDTGGGDALYKARAGTAKAERIFAPVSTGAPTTLSFIRWSRRGDRILIEALQSESRSYFLVSNDGSLIGQVTSIEGVPLAAEDRVVFSPSDSNTLIALTGDKELYRISAGDGSLGASLITANVLSFEIVKDRMLFAVQGSSGTELFEIAGSRTEPDKIADLPESESYELAFSNLLGKRTYLTLLNDRLLVTTFGESQKEYPVSALKVLVSPNDNFAALIGGVSVDVLNLERGEMSTFTIDEGITFMDWFGDGYHFLALSNKKVLFMDWDGNYLNEIAATGRDSRVEYSLDSRSIYFLDDRETLTQSTNERAVKSFLFAISLEDSYR